MAIAAVLPTYLTQGPSASGQILVSSPLSTTEEALVLIGTATLDGTTTSFTLDFIDGTQTLSFTPRAVPVAIVGGTATNVPAVSTGSITNTGVTVNLSAAGTSGQTLVLCAQILK